MPPSLTFFCELDTPELAALLADGTVIAQLRALGASIRMGIRDLSDTRAEIVRRLNSEGIPLVAWQLLPDDVGYWYNRANAHHAIEHYDAFVRWSRQHNLQWRGIGIDIEPDIRELEAGARHPFRMLARLVKRMFEGKQLRVAQTHFGSLVQRMRADGYPVESYIIPFILDERRAGSTMLQRFTGLVEVAVDCEVPMLYTSFLRPLGVPLLWSYARTNAATGIGSTGGGVTAGGLDQVKTLDWAEFSRDLRLAAQHANTIYIFSLEGCVRQDFLPRLLRFDWHVPIKPAFAQVLLADLARALLQTMLWLGERPWAALVVLVVGLAWKRDKEKARREDSITK